MSNGFADSNRASLRYIAEDSAAWGVTPVNGVVREMRLTGSELKPSKETKTSQELRSDRMVPSIIEVGAKTDGDIKIEFSAGAMDDFLAAFVYGGWSRPMTQDKFQGVAVSVIANNKVAIAGGDVSAYFTAGRRIKTEGFLAAANNDYLQISSVTFNAGANRTEVTVTASSLVAEVGSAATKVIDANDVIVLKNTSIRAGTAGAASFDSNGTNAFAAAVAAGQIKVGQKVFVEFPVHEAGTVTFAAAPAAGTQVIVNDGSKDLVFQFGGAVLSKDRAVAPGADETETAANLAAALMVAHRDGLLNVKAAAAAGVVTVTNLNSVGGVLAEASDTGAAVTIANFAGGDASTRGVFTVTSVADDEIGVSPKPGTHAGGAAVTVKGAMLRNPSVVTDFIRQSFSIETSFEDIGQHFLARGLRVGTFDLNVQAGEIVTGSIQFMGSETKRASVAKLRGGAYTNKKATEFEVMNATSNVGNLTKNGLPVATGIKEITLKGDGALREQRCVGNKFASGIGVGRFSLKGTIHAYFESGELFDHFVNHDTIALGWGFTDVEGQHYEFTLPAIKITSDPVSPGKIDEDVMENMDWEAQRDPATSCMIQVDRFSSIKAPTA